MMSQPVNSPDELNGPSSASGDLAQTVLGDLLDSLDVSARQNVTALFIKVYDDLHQLAFRYLKQERPDHTLQATALVNEAFLLLQKGKAPQWADRAHFFRIAARTMRHILVNHAQRHGAAKRGGGRRPVNMEESLAICDGTIDENLLLLHEALVRLAQHYPQKAAIVELRYFGGCTIEQTAETLGISTATVERDWRFARAWLMDQLQSGES